MKTIGNKIKKTFIIIIITALLLVQGGNVYAFEIPQAPSAPEAPSSQEAPPASTAPPEAPSAPESPTAPEAPTEEEVLNPTVTPAEPSEDNQTADNDSQSSTSAQNETNATSDPQTDSQAGTVSNGNMGDTTIDTGDATSTGVINSFGNTNESLIPLSDSNCLGCTGGSDSIGIINDNNGTNSNNNGSVSLTEENIVIQDNIGHVNNSLNQTSVSGQNSTSQNTNGDSTIKTGDANTSGTVITGVNTNVAGVSVSEFNIADDHIGDIVLDFASSCITGCNSGGDTTLANKNNGTSSQNNAALTDITNNYIFQNNDAEVLSDLTLVSDSGNNTASQNTGGDSTIETEDANVSANVLTFVNNNLSGNVIFGVVNIFGDLVGDILLPESEVNKALASGETVLANVNNGADSSNTASLDQTTNNSAFQTNDATIENNLILDANTGGNDASKNTNGNSSVETGDSSVDVQMLNIANSNIIGGYWWLVIVNEAGNWIGKLLGAPDDANFAGSAGTEFIVNPDGTITAINANNGADSNNNSQISQTTNNVLAQTNTANVVNNLNLTANTGNNTASKNTNGDSSINTGDAKIVANLVNFVNNNISGNGKLVVTMVNVFGSWLGDFILPGQKKENKSDLAKTADDPSEPAYTKPDDNDNPIGIGGGTGSLPNSNNDSTSENNSQGQATTAAVQTDSKTTLSQGSKNTNIIKTAMLFAGISADRSSDENALSGAVNKVNSSKSKKVSVNLAWFILLIPLGTVSILIKKIYLKKTYTASN